MGVFYLNCEIKGVRPGARLVSVTKALVDTGSELSWMPADVLTRARVQVAKKDVSFVMANGCAVTRSTGYAILRAGGFETVDEVVFAQAGDLLLLGARTLEGFGAVVDPRKKRLVAAGPHLAAIGK